MTNHTIITYKGPKMKATMFCNANYLIYLNGQDEIIAYQLDESTIKKMYFTPIQFPIALPQDTAKTLVLNDIRSVITYEKDNISDTLARIVTYEINISTLALAMSVKKNLSKSLNINSEEEICLAFMPTFPEYKDKLYQCDYCINKIYCVEK